MQNIMDIDTQPGVTSECSCYVIAFYGPKNSVNGLRRSLEHLIASRSLVVIARNYVPFLMKFV